MKSMVVDDVALNCRMLKALLEPYGDCHMANDARTTVQLFQKAWKTSAPYNLICLDIQMPDIDGLKLLQVLRQMEEKMVIEEDRRARIMMVTGSDVQETHRKARALGCDAVIVKPIHRDDLMKLVKEWKLVEGLAGADGKAGPVVVEIGDGKAPA